MALRRTLPSQRLELVDEVARERLGQTRSMRIALRIDGRRRNEIFDAVCEPQSLFILRVDSSVRHVALLADSSLRCQPSNECASAIRAKRRVERDSCPMPDRAFCAGAQNVLKAQAAGPENRLFRDRCGYTVQGPNRRPRSPR